MNKSNERFREYVTGTTFNLTLSRNMIHSLSHLNICEGKHINDNWAKYGGYCYAINTSTRESLERRGLVKWEFDEGPHLTEAGKLVLELCRLAGLLDVVT